jgi:hypothetical protein
MKELLQSIIFTVFVLCSRAEHKTLVLIHSGSIDVPSGSVIDIISAYQQYYETPIAPVDVRVENLPGSNVTFSYFELGSFSHAQPLKNLVLAGPIRIRFDFNQPGVLITYKITNATSGLSAVGPSNTVVVPEDISGPISIILESSTDLINWTAAQPGQYGASTTKRFFRIRATQNQE